MSVESTSKEEKMHISKEMEAINQIESLINNWEHLSSDEVKTQLKGFAKSYKRLLQEVQLLTSVGDRLQKKVKTANEILQEQAEEIRKINQALQDKNIELQFTIDELTKAKAGKRATTIILFFALVLFIITEILESTFENFFTGANMLIIYGFKVTLALGFKPIEGFLEQAIIAREMKLQRLEHEMQKKALEEQKKKASIQKPIIPKIEIIQKETSSNRSTDSNLQVNSSENQAIPNTQSEMSPEAQSKLERKLKRETMKKMGENRE